MSYETVVPGDPNPDSTPETPPAAAPAAPPEPPPADDAPDDDDGISDITVDELRDQLRSVFAEEFDSRLPKPEPEPEPDPYEDVDEGVRPHLRKIDDLERRLAAAEAKNAEREAAERSAAWENDRVADLRAGARALQMTKEEVMEVAKFVDENLSPDVADKLKFEQLAILWNPALASRRKANGAPTPKQGSPAKEPPSARLVEVGSGGDAPPKSRHPGPGKGFDDIHAEARRELAGKLFITE